MVAAEAGRLQIDYMFHLNPFVDNPIVPWAERLEVFLWHLHVKEHNSRIAHHLGQMPVENFTHIMDASSWLVHFVQKLEFIEVVGVCGWVDAGWDWSVTKRVHDGMGWDDHEVR